MRSEIPKKGEHTTLILKNRLLTSDLESVVFNVTDTYYVLVQFMLL